MPGKSSPRRDGTTPEKPADNLVRARVSLEEEVATRQPRDRCVVDPVRLGDGSAALTSFTPGNGLLLLVVVE